MDMPGNTKLLRLVAIAHGIYYLATGLWPLFGMQSFEAVTGPKFDDWLVKNNGLMFAGSGLAFLAAGLRQKYPFEVFLLALANTLCVAGIDFYYSLADRIWMVYFIEGWVEILLAVLWIVAWRKRGKSV